MTVAAAKIFHYDCGTAAGLMAGAFTESTVIGTAGDTIKRLDLPEAEKTRLLNNIPVAYAVSYLVGTGFVVWFLSSLAPRLLKVDLKAESREARGGDHGREGARAGRAVGVPGMGPARLPDRRRAWADRTVGGPREDPSLPSASSSSGSTAAASARRGARDASCAGRRGRDRGPPPRALRRDPDRRRDRGPRRSWTSRPTSWTSS